MLLNDYELPLPAEDTLANKIFHNRPSDIHELLEKKNDKKRSKSRRGNNSRNVHVYLKMKKCFNYKRLSMETFMSPRMT